MDKFGPVLYLASFKNSLNCLDCGVSLTIVSIYSMQLSCGILSCLVIYDSKLLPVVEREIISFASTFTVVDLELPDGPVSIIRLIG